MRNSPMLQEFFYGNISPWERTRIQTREYQELANEMDSIVKHFKNLLSPEEYKKLTEMQDIQAELNILDELDLFAYAFRTAALLMIDVFNYEGND